MASKFLSPMKMMGKTQEILCKHLVLSQDLPSQMLKGGNLSYKEGGTETEENVDKSNYVWSSLFSSVNSNLPKVTIILLKQIYTS